MCTIMGKGVFRYMNNLPQKLFELRKSRGLLQEELAEKLGVSRQAVSKWEMGTGVPTLENLISISEFFGVTIDSLVKNDYDTAVSAPEERQHTDQSAYSPVYPYVNPKPHAEPTPLQKAVVNILTLIFASAVISCLMWAIGNLLPLVNIGLQRLLYEKLSRDSFNQIQIVLSRVYAISGYVFSTILCIPYFTLLYMFFGKNKCLFSRAQSDKSEPLSKRLGMKKVMIMFLIKIIIDIAINLITIHFSLDSAWRISSVLIEYFILYTMFTWGKPNIYKQAKTLIPTVLITIALTAATMLLNYNSLHVVMTAVTAGHITYPILYNVVSSIMMQAVICTFIWFHAECAYKTDGKEQKNTPEA